MQQRGSHWTDFYKVWCWAFSKNLPRELKFDKNQTRMTVTLHICLYTFVVIYRWIILKMRNVSYRVAQKIRLHILGSTTLFRKSCRLWANVKRYGRSRGSTYGSMIRCMRWITKATHTIFNSDRFFMAAVFSRMHLNITVCIHCLSCSYSWEGLHFRRVLLSSEWKYSNKVVGIRNIYFLYHVQYFQKADWFRQNHDSPVITLLVQSAPPRALDAMPSA